MNHAHDFLKIITPLKEKEVEDLRERKNPFQALFETASHAPVLIAEIKPKSPSGGELFKGDPVELAKTYADSGADAISVLTDEKFFGGSMTLLENIRAAVSVPVLRKEFIIDRLQLLQTVNRADAVLLIVSILSKEKLHALIAEAADLGLTPVVEVATSEELDIALGAGAAIIGVNARDLRNPDDVNTDRALKVLETIPQSVIALSFSGIESRADVERAVAHGARGVLVGTSLLREGNDMGKVAHKVKELKNI